MKTIVLTKSFEELMNRTNNIFEPDKLKQTHEKATPLQHHQIGIVKQTSLESFASRKIHSSTDVEREEK